ncbi:MAG: ABC transporter permease [Dehalococcoidia bacterium]|nr:ABC transporter permease [Dehalococcoidia bacterium]
MSAASTTSSEYVDDVFIRPRPPIHVRVWRTLVDFVLRKPLGAFGGFMLIVVIFVGVFSPVLAPSDLNQIYVGEQLQGPSASHWLGTDHNGKDILSNIIYGSQVTALVGVGTVLLTGMLSLLVGVLSGYFGGKTDFAIQRVVDVWMSFPAIFLILTLVAVLGAGSGGGILGLGRGPDIGPNPQGGDWIWNTLPRSTIVILVLGVVLAGGASRVVRSAVFSVKASPYIEAATVIGADSRRIILKHVVPNIMATVIVLATVQLGVAVLAEATLSFLGIGITNFPTWGQMLSGRTRDLVAQNLHLAISPGIAIFLAVFGFNMLGDALRDVLDPRLRGSR